jgi:lipoprotein-anchoring transpeptidase ErfK/SrfK
MEARRGDDPDVLRRAVSSRAWDDRYPAELRGRWLEESRRLAKRVVFSATPMAKAITVVVKDGDHYVGISQRLRREHSVAVTPAFLQLVNDVAPEKLRPKMSLKAPLEPLSLVVDKDEFRLYVLLGDCHVLDYEVGIGKDEKTPEGAFTIQWKTKEPVWTDPKTGKVIKYGQPGHVIGSRWLGFAAADGGRTGLGIHGTTEPGSVGKAQSDGCVRMRTPDVEALFELVPTGTKVVVRR